MIVNQGKKVAVDSTQAIIKKFGANAFEAVEIRFSGDIDRDEIRSLSAAYPVEPVEGNEEGQYTLVWASEGTPQANLIELMKELDAKGVNIEHVGRRSATLEEAFMEALRSA